MPDKDAIDDRPSMLTDHDRQELVVLFAGRVSFDQPLAPLTWWRIGGPADALVNVSTSEELQRVFEFCRRRRLAWFVLGNGSNLLIGDGGMRGVVIRLDGDFTRITIADDCSQGVMVEAGGAASLALLVGQAASRGAIGVDALAGIPATVGGAARMNAGTEREIGEFLREVTIQTLSRPVPHCVNVQYLYRRTSLDPAAIVASVKLVFEAGDPSGVRAALQQRLVRRKATQPVAQPNAGSCFRNPPGDRAGRLIEAVGAKGWRIGDAEVSTIHANFIVNLGQATAEDVSLLLMRVRTAVSEKFAIALDLEVHFVGIFTSQEAATGVSI